MGMGVFQQREPKMPGAHKIGAAISAPRIAGGNFMDIALFLSFIPPRQHEPVRVCERALLQNYEQKMEVSMPPREREESNNTYINVL